MLIITIVHWARRERRAIVLPSRFFERDRGALVLNEANDKWEIEKIELRTTIAGRNIESGSRGKNPSAILYVNNWYWSSLIFGVISIEFLPLRSTPGIFHAGIGKYGWSLDSIRGLATIDDVIVNHYFDRVIAEHSKSYSSQLVCVLCRKCTRAPRLPPRRWAFLSVWRKTNVCKSQLAQSVSTLISPIDNRKTRPLPCRSPFSRVSTVRISKAALWPAPSADNCFRYKPA